MAQSVHEYLLLFQHFWPGSVYYALEWVILPSVHIQTETSLVIITFKHNKRFCGYVYVQNLSINLCISFDTIYNCLQNSYTFIHMYHQEFLSVHALWTF